MFNFGGITHIIENPKGHTPGYNFSLVGSVPCSMLFAYHGKRWESVEDILLAAAIAGDVKLCTSPTCACRNLFPDTVSHYLNS